MTDTSAKSCVWHANVQPKPANAGSHSLAQLIRDVGDHLESETLRNHVFNVGDLCLGAQTLATDEERAG